jgi:RNA polymerase sigma-70 factor (sigma-E family)
MIAGAIETEEAAAFCRRLHPVLLGGLTPRCRDRAIAEEVVQETLVRVWERWASLDPARGSPEAWAWRVALNLVASGFRRRAVEQRALDRLEAQASASSGAPPDEAQADRLAVRAALADLPERQRAALVLRFYADLSVAQTAAVLGCAEGTVKSLTNRAVDALRHRLADDRQPGANTVSRASEAA